MPELQRQMHLRDAARDASRVWPRNLSGRVPPATASTQPFDPLITAPARLRQIKISAAKMYGWRAWAFSGAVHALLVCCSFLWVIHGPRSPSPATVVNDWSVAEPTPAENFANVDLHDQPLQVSTEPAAFIGTPGGGAAEWSGLEMSAAMEGTAAELDSHIEPTGWLSDRLSEKIPGEGTGGPGDGHGKGNGGGTPFFGAPTEGERLVFVVDCSGSMRHRHAEAGTRLERVKYELRRVISKLSVEQRYFVIFFSDKGWPMPGRKLQAATRENKARSLEWISSIVPNGDTQPRGALKYAFKLHPTSVYLLTDGLFDPATALLLNGLNRAGTAIHTVGVGHDINRELLERIAHDSGGTFRLVP